MLAMRTPGEKITRRLLRQGCHGLAGECNRSLRELHVRGAATQSLAGTDRKHTTRHQEHARQQEVVATVTLSGLRKTQPRGSRGVLQPALDPDTALQRGDLRAQPRPFLV